MKSFLCKINIHDWEVLETKCAKDIKTNYDEKNGVNSVSGTPFEYSTYFQNRICMKCDKIDSGIEEYEFLLFQCMRRRELAVKKYEKKED